MAKIKVSIINPSTLKLEEKGEIGDIIDLRELQSVDNTLILEAINQEKDQTYKSQLESVIKHQEGIKQIALNELEKKLNKELEDLRIEKEKLTTSLNSFRDKLITEKELTKATITAEYSIEKTHLENRIKELETSIDQQK